MYCSTNLCSLLLTFYYVTFSGTKYLTKAGFCKDGANNNDLLCNKYVMFSLTVQFQRDDHSFLSLLNSRAEYVISVFLSGCFL